VSQEIVERSSFRGFSTDTRSGASDTARSLFTLVAKHLVSHFVLLFYWFRLNRETLEFDLLEVSVNNMEVG
jgi:hypothetical protein